MKKLDHPTEEQWAQVNDFNRFIWKDFLDNSAELSSQTLKAYTSNLRVWFIWVLENLNNKKQVDIKPLDFKRFQNWMINRGCSSADICNKRAAISSLNNYIETYYQEEHPLFRNFINKSIKRPPKAFVHEKAPLTKDEFSKLMSVLRERGEWQKVAYLMFTFETGCRRAESRQVLKEVVNAEPIVKKKVERAEDGSAVETELIVYQTHPIRCKGAGEAGKVRRLLFGSDTREAFVRWLEERGNDDCPYMFVTRKGDSVAQVSETCFNSWAKRTFEPIIGRRFHPHLLRESRATQAVVEEGKDINAVRALLGHNDTQTTEIYVIRKDADDFDELY